MQNTFRRRIAATVLTVIVVAAAGAGVGHSTATAGGSAPRHFCPPIC
jgi:hypothetical protein